MDRLRRDLAEVLQHGTPGQRKAVIENHIAEIKIQGTLLLPIFLIPANDEGPADTAADPTFRTTVHVVGRTRRCANRTSRLPVIRCRKV
jgi:site-specific DNA recombinase